jgi:hypothetical protein
MQLAVIIVTNVSELKHARKVSVGRRDDNAPPNQQGEFEVAQVGKFGRLPGLRSVKGHESKLKDLTRMREALSGLIDACQHAASADPCPIIQALARASGSLKENNQAVSTCDARGEGFRQIF